jgi:hypothetical protein
MKHLVPLARANAAACERLVAAIAGQGLTRHQVVRCRRAVPGWWKIATARPGEHEPSGEPVGLVGAAVFQWVNPKSWLVCASAAATFLDRGAGSALAQSAALGL